MNEIKTHLLWAVVVLAVSALIACVIAYAVHEHHVTSREAMKAGLVQKPDPGQGFHWEKP